MACRPRRVAPASSTPRSRVGTAVGLHRVAGAASRHTSGPLRCQQLFCDDLDQPLQVLWIHGRPSSLRIFIRRLMYRASVIAVPSHRSTMRMAASVPGTSGRSEREDVGTVVLSRVSRGRLIEAHRGANAADLVGGDGGADASAVNHDSGVSLLPRDRQRRRLRRYRDSRPAQRRRCRRR